MIYKKEIDSFDLLNGAHVAHPLLSLCEQKVNCILIARYNFSLALI